MLRAKRRRDEQIRACAPNFVAIARTACLCAQQKNFAQFTVREGAKGVESIKKERISAR
jgi:hypothetical protein